MYCKDYVVKELAAHLPELTLEEVESGIEIPKEKSMGDYAFPCFRLAKTMHKAPQLIAAELAQKLQNSDIVEKVEAVGPYVNLFLDKKWRASFILGQVQEAEKEGRAFGSSTVGEGKTVVLDYSSINCGRNPFILGICVRP